MAFTGQQGEDKIYSAEQLDVGAIGAGVQGFVSFSARFTELAQDNVTAAGNNQATAQATTGQTIRVTSAAAGTGITLPPSAAGLELVVINHGANPIQVYGNGTDQIDDFASATGVTQMASSVVIYTCTTAGNWYTEGLANGYAGGLQTVSFVNNITAAGSSQGTATVLTPAMAYNVTTVAASTGVLLPASVAGAEVAIANNGANALLIYPNGTDKINALAAGAGFSAAAGTVTILYCFAAGQWYTK